MLKIFESFFGVSSSEFASTHEIDKFIENKIRRKLEVKDIYTDICSSRGNIFPIKEMNADEIFEKAINKE